MSTDGRTPAPWQPIIIPVRDDLVTDEAPTDLYVDAQRICDEKAPGSIAQFDGWTKATAPDGYTFATFYASRPLKSGMPRWRPPYVGELLTLRGQRVRVTSVQIDDPTNLSMTGFTMETEPATEAEVR